jgi:hypothetical protein
MVGAYGYPLGVAIDRNVERKGTTVATSEYDAAHEAERAS